MSSCCWCFRFLLVVGKSLRFLVIVASVSDSDPSDRCQISETPCDCCWCFRFLLIVSKSVRKRLGLASSDLYSILSQAANLLRRADVAGDDLAAELGGHLLDLRWEWENLGGCEAAGTNFGTLVLGSTEADFCSLVNTRCAALFEIY